MYTTENPLPRLHFPLVIMISLHRICHADPSPTLVILLILSHTDLTG